MNVSPKLPPLLPLAETDRQVVMELRDALLEPGVVLLEPGVVLLAAPAPACYSAEYFRLATDEILKPEPGAGQSPPSDPGTGGDFGSIAAVRLRCDSEAALQADLVAFNRRLGYPERLARASDHPRIGLFRFLAKSPSTVVCLEGLRDPQLLDPLLPRLQTQSVLITLDLQRTEQISVPHRQFALSADLAAADGRRLCRSRLQSLGLSSDLAETGPDALWSRPTVVRTICGLAALGVLPELLPADLPDDDRTLTQKLWRDAWPRIPHGGLRTLLQLVACVDARFKTLGPLQTAWDACLSASDQIDSMPAAIADGVARGLLRQDSGSDVFRMDADVHSVLYEAIPEADRETALTAWASVVSASPVCPREPEAWVLHVDRLAQHLAVSRARRSAAAIKAARGAAECCRAIGATRRGAKWAEAIASGLEQTQPVIATLVARARLWSAEIYRSGGDLRSARIAAREAASLLTDLSADSPSLCVEACCERAEIELADGLSERANALLQEARDRLQVGQIPELLLARWMYLRAACLIAGKQHLHAEPLLRRTLQIRERSLGAGHEQTVAARSLVARNLFAQQKWVDAEKILRSDLSCRRETDSVTPIEVATAANLLADLLFAQGRYAEAEPLLEEVLSIRRQTLDPKDRLVAEVATRLASLKTSRGDYSEADQLFRLALSITERVFGDEHPRVADILNELAKMLFTQTRYDQSRRLLERALSIQQKSLRKTDSRIAESRNNLAAVYVARGHYEYAARLYSENLAAARAHLPGDHPPAATALNNLGDVLRSLGRYREAEELLAEALSMRERLFGEQHPVVAQSLSNLGYLWMLQGRMSDAQTAVTRALEIRRARLGAAHPHIANSLTTLGRIHRRDGNHEAAKTAFEEAADIHRQVVGERHQLYGANLALVGRTELALGRRARAELNLLKSRVILDETVGSNHRLYIDVLLGLAELYEAEHRPADAFPLLERAVAIQKQTAGRDHIQTAESLLAIARNLVTRRAPEQALPRAVEADQLLSQLKAPPQPLLTSVLCCAARAALDCGQTETAGGFVSRIPANTVSLECVESDELRLLRANLMVGRGEYAAAEAVYRDMLAEVDSQPDGDRETRTTLLDQLSAAVVLQGRHRDAEPLIRENLKLVEQKFGRRHAEFADRLNQLAAVLAGSERLDEAASLLDEVTQIYEQLGGADPARTAEVIRKRADLMRRLQRADESVRLERLAESLQGRSSHVLEDIL